MNICFGLATAKIIYSHFLHPSYWEILYWENNEPTLDISLITHSKNIGTSGIFKCPSIGNFSISFLYRTIYFRPCSASTKSELCSSMCTFLILLVPRWRASITYFSSVDLYITSDIIVIKVTGKELSNSVFDPPTLVSLAIAGVEDSVGLYEWVDWDWDWKYLSIPSWRFEHALLLEQRAENCGGLSLNVWFLGMLRISMLLRLFSSGFLPMQGYLLKLNKLLQS